MEAFRETWDDRRDEGRGGTEAAACWGVQPVEPVGSGSALHGLNGRNECSEC